MRTPTADQLFDWAEKNYAPFFPGHQTSRTAAPYTYRYYPDTGNYLGISGSAVAILGPVSGGQVLVVGQVADFACLVFPSDCNAPVIATQPVALGVVAAQPASFSVVASGSPAPSYQWQISSDGGQTYVDIPGATAASYSLPATTLADNGKRYRVRLSNAVGSIVSSAAVLTVTAAPISLAKVAPTGIQATQCYAAGGTALVSCSSAAALALSGQGKQDGMIGGAFAYAEVPRPGGGFFARTECVSDTITGLTWSGHAPDTYRAPYVLQTNYGDKRSGDVSAYVNAFNVYALCGYKDWRLPTADELTGLLNYGLSGAEAMVDPAWLPNSAFKGYWSGTPSVSPLVAAATFSYEVSFDDGQVQNAQNGLKFAMRFVRGGQFLTQGARFTPVADGSEVADARTGLVWRRCVEGMVWDGRRCAGSATGFSHEGALAHARQQAGWRLPNVKELFSVADLAMAEPTIDTAAFPNTPFRSYWSSTPRNDHEAWSVDFYRGGVMYAARDRYPAVSSQLVRLVRTGKDVQADLTAPAISRQPRAAQVLAPRAATFSVVAAGSPQPQYQWQRGDGVNFSDIAGANGATYILPATALSDSGQWLRVRIANALGAVTSDAVALTVSAPPLAPLPVPATGIGPASCYARFTDQLVACDSAAAIELAGPGKQDGMSGGRLAYSEVPSAGGGYHPRTECIVDDATGLMWEGKPFDGGVRDATRLYTNHGDKRAGDASAYVDTVNALGLCGHADWRLPTVGELIGVADFSKPWPGPAVDWDWLANTHAVSSLWSGTFSLQTGAATGRQYWLVNVTSLDTGSTPGQVTAGVRLVRGGKSPPAGPRFVPSADGSEVSDRATGLVWRRCLQGMTWTGSTCKGRSLNFTQEQALDHARQQAGWRLPNVKELASLVDYTQSPLVIDSAAFPNLMSDVTFSRPNIWSSTPLLGDQSAVADVSRSRYAWLARGGGGIIGYAAHSDTQLSQSSPGWGVLLVRMP